MKNIKCTFYKNMYDTTGKLTVSPWCDIFTLFLQHKVRGRPSDTSNDAELTRNKNGPAVVLGVVEGGRKSVNVREIHALALDLEKKTDTEISGIIEKIQDFEWVMYSTHRHGAAVVGSESRLRIIFPLENPLKPSEFFDVWDNLNSYVDGANDPQTRDLARLHFLPSTFNPDIAISHHNEGKFLNPLNLPKSTVPDTPSLNFEAVEYLEMLDLLEKKQRAMPVSHYAKQSLKALLVGKPFAEPGNRHDVLLRITYWLAHKLQVLPENYIERLFAASLKEMQNHASPPTHKEIFQAYEGALAKIAEDQNKAAPDLPEVREYSSEELDIIAKKQGLSPSDLHDKWVVQKSGTVWVLDEQGEYQGPYSKDDAPVAIQRFLKRAPVKLWTATPSGYHLRPAINIVSDHGSLAKKIVTDLGAQYTTFEPETQIIRESIVPIRKELVPTYYKEIDQWFDILEGGPLGKIRDWVSCCADLKRQLCAVYFDGEKEAGKTLFAVGVARMWTTGGPAEVSEVLNNYNEELCRCPLVFADEDIPKATNGQNTSAKLRALLGVKERTLKRKYLAGSDLVGALRIILAANNESLLDELGAQTAADLEAVAQRFLYIKVPKASAVYLSDISKPELEDWASYKIAEHALWLRDNHEVKSPGRRFWVEGDLTQIHQLLLTGGHWTSLVCEWLIRYLLNPTPLHADSAASPLIKIQDNQLLVNEQVLCDKWRLYLKDTRQDPVTRQIGQALRAISEPKRRQLRHKYRQIRYRVIIMSHLLAWSERHGIGDGASIADRISGAIPLEQEIDASVGRTEKDRSFMEY